MLGAAALPLLLAAAAAGAAEPTVRYDLRPDGVPVLLAPQTAASFDYPFKPFPTSFVEKAKATSVDWQLKGAVTPAKDQGAHGYCGTFGRVGAAEGQYAILSGHGLRNFSEEELVDCIGWTKDGSSGHPDQFDYFSEHGFMDEKDYPYCTGGPTCKGDHDPPVPGHPCAFDKTKAIPGTAGGKFTNTTGGAPSEDQMLAFLYKNGPVNTGINANVFGLREKGCESKAGSCFITPEMCNKTHGSIDHSILLTGYGTDPENGGDYWIVKNSWSTKFANDGFIKVARGIGCAGVSGKQTALFEPFIYKMHYFTKTGSGRT